jgi:hypothetical protein
LRGSQGWRESWPTSFSLRRPPRRDGTGVREIGRRRTSLRRSGGNESAAWNVRRSLAAILTKAKNKKCHNYNYFFCDFPEIMYSHLVHMYDKLRSITGRVGEIWPGQHTSKPL